MDWTQSDWNSMRANQESAMNTMYQNTRASHSERTQRKSIILDVSIGTNLTFNETLHEPLKIDKLSDIYLEAFTTFQPKTGGDKTKIGFLLNINEFNINTNSNNSKAYNSIFIPNDQTTVSDPALVRTHKGKKLNYICSINPETISKLSGSLTLLDGSTTIFASTNGRFIAEFVIVARE